MEGVLYILNICGDTILALERANNRLQKEVEELQAELASLKERQPA